jgi:hypothetical protein
MKRLALLINRKIKNKICGAEDVGGLGLPVAGRADPRISGRRCPPVTRWR